MGGGRSGGGGFGGQLDVNWTGRGGYDAAWGGGVGVDLATQTNGGFGGGGGAAFSSNSDLGAFAGAGGFGGGGGSDPWGGAQGGFGAGAGDFTQGGGGLGAGGDIFVQQGASLTILASAIAAGTVAGGSGAVNGSAFGSGIFLQGDETLDLGSSQAAYSSLTISGVIADGAGSGGTGVGALAIYGQGQTLSFDTNTVKLTAANTFTGGVTIYGGALELGATGAAGTGAITFGVPPQNSYAKPEILVDSGVSLANAVAHFGADDAIEFVGLTYSASDFVTYVANAQNTGGVVKICAPGGAVLASFTVRGDYNRFNFRLEEAYDPTPGATNITVSYRSTTTSDFSGNGLSDILWRNSSGDLNFWLDSPYGVTPQAVPLHSDWQVAGVGDFAGAGHDA